MEGPYFTAIGFTVRAIRTRSGSEQDGLAAESSPRVLSGSLTIPKAPPFPWLLRTLRETRAISGSLFISSSVVEELHSRGYSSAKSL